MRGAAMLAALVGVAGCTAILGVTAIPDVQSSAQDGGEDSPFAEAGAADAAPLDAATAPADAGRDGAAVAPPPSCLGLARTCGRSAGEDCCASTVISGGTFHRSYDGVPDGGYTDPSFVATVSDFRLDTFEITVGRFRKFVAGYPENLPLAGAGKNPKNPSDPGWDASWNANMPQTQAALTSALNCYSPLQSWTDAPGGNETLAIGCVSWYEAFAFCIWDGGRLPTEAEWNYAAAGGNEQRVYPWSIPPTSTTVDGTYAVYSDPAGSGHLAPVGSKSPNGDGKWGHADLAGNVYEWTLDWYRTPYAINPCTDCSDLAFASYRVVRGGSFYWGTEKLLTSPRVAPAPSTHDPAIGARCVRAP